MNTETIAQPVAAKQLQEKPAKVEPKPQENGKGQAKIEIKSVKHVFTADERNRFGDDLARTIANLRGIEGELEQVKASFKSKITEAQARIDRLSTDLCGGFEMRDQRCQVRYFPKDRRKRYWLESANPDKDVPVLEEDMSKDDYQTELLNAESKFNHREEIVLFPRAGNDFGVMVVGETKGMWFAALRVQIGGNKLEERLDSEQACAKKRYDIIKRTGGRFADWLVERLGKDNAKGFQEPLEKAVLTQRERVE